MKRFIIAAILLMLVSMPFASAQLQFEAGLGITERNYLDTGVAVGYDFTNAPITLGLQYHCEAALGGSYVWNPVRCGAIFARAYTGKGHLRLGGEVVGELRTFHYGAGQVNMKGQRSLYLQPSLAYYFTDSFGIRLNLFRFGWWPESWPVPEYGNAAGPFPETYASVEPQPTDGLQCNFKVGFLSFIWRLDFSKN